MRRWNGWGDDTVVYPLPDSALHYLESLVGKGEPPKDADFAVVLKSVPDSRLQAHDLVDTAPAERARHACGQSMPDWIAMRSGSIPTFPDGVAYPVSEEDIVELFRYARQTGAHLIPYGGGTSVTGHITPLPGDNPVLCVDMSRMNRLLSFNSKSHLATFGAGISGPDLEAQLRARGFTLGHFPQSFELSTLGGWIATRSSGQQSLGYGRIEKLFSGGRVHTPLGVLELPSFPASAAGPDLKELVLGSEGRLGILSHATVRVTPLPQREEFHAVFFPDFEHGQAAVQQILWAGIPLSMLRLSTAVETETTLALAGHERLIGALEQLLSIRGLGALKCMLLAGFTGRESIVKTARKEAFDLTGKFSGIHVGRMFGNQWHKSRFQTPYLRNTLWSLGYAIDTVETATGWENVPGMVEDVRLALCTALTDLEERVHVFTHLSHVYPHGSGVYTTYLFRLAADPQETLQRWQALKSAASQAILHNGGTISHQHGIGLDHRLYLQAEKGELGIGLLQDVFRYFDPQGIMNPGKLVI